jgi:hypothetical protein
MSICRTVKPITTRMNLFRTTCPSCEGHDTAKAPADGARGLAVRTRHKGCGGLSARLLGFKRLTELCEGVFGLTISQGALSN